MNTMSSRAQRGVAGVLALTAVAAVTVLATLQPTTPAPFASEAPTGRLIPATAAPSTVAPAPTAPAGTAAAASPLSPIRIGAVFPLIGDAAPLARAELRGVQIAADAVNAAGGVGGRRIELDVQEVDSVDQAGPALNALQAEGAAVVIGTYSSALSIPVSTAAAARGLVYWESGAVADRLTGRGLPLVFRVGASGSNLGTNSADFAAAALAPRLGKSVAALRVAVVHADDDYATSVAAAAERTALTSGMQIVAREQYHLGAPRFAAIMRRLARSRPDVVILASHIPDGIAFRQAMLKAHLKVGALIGTTMAECVPDFAIPLGRDVVGIFGSDRPAGNFDPKSLSPDAYAVYERFEAAWEESAPAAGSPDPGWGTPTATPAPSASPAASGGWGSQGSSAFEEGLSGFTAGWALFNDVLPRATASGTVTAQSIADAARGVDLAAGSLPNGAGLRFSTDIATMGQNERAIGMVWQWQAAGTDVVVWPQTFATGPIDFVPLPR